MKLWTSIILLYSVNIFATSSDCLKTVRKSQASRYVAQPSEMNFLRSQNVDVEQQMVNQSESAYLGGASAQGAHCSHSMDVFHHNSVNYSHASADMDRTVRCKKPLFAPPHYDGTTSLPQFRQSFNDAAIMNSWETEMEKALWLRSSLKAQARGIIYDNCYDVNELWSRLESRFGESLKIRQYERLLSTRIRQHNESLTDLADDIRKMAVIVYRGINYHAQERLMISCFIRALSDIDMEYDISLQRPATLDEALLIAQNREIYFNPESKGSSTMNNICSSALNPNWCENHSYNSGCSNELRMEPNNYGSNGELSENDTAALYSMNNVTEKRIHQPNNCEVFYTNEFQHTFANLDSEMGNAMPIPR